MRRWVGDEKGPATMERWLRSIISIYCKTMLFTSPGSIESQSITGGSGGKVGRSWWAILYPRIATSVLFYLFQLVLVT
jgi:hypothetical protein